MIKLYGATQSRAFRALWMLEEIGVEYEHHPVSSRETRTAEFLAINPNGHIPVLVDGDLTLVESMAINLYLAARYGGELWPASVEDQGRVYQWSFWGMLEVEADLLTAMRHRLLNPEDQRDPAAAAAAEARLQAPLGVLDAALQGREYLAGPGFTVGDLNLAAVLSWSRGAQVGLDPFPNVARWYGACFGRAGRKAASRK